jgi:hypothetical protein
MRRLITILSIPLVVLSCGKRIPKVDYENQNTADSVKIENLISDTTKTLVADLPILFDSTKFLIHPIAVIDLNAKLKRSFESSSYSSSSYSESDFDISSSREDYISGNMTNLVFENVGSKEERLLTDNVIRIRTFRFLREIFKKIKKEYLLYTVIDRDSNNDKKLDYNDIESLYVSKIDGTDFKKLTKDQHEYFSGELIPGDLKYYYKTIEDVNRDGQFDRHDKIHYYYLDFSGDPIKVTEYYPLKLIIK